AGVISLSLSAAPMPKIKGHATPQACFDAARGAVGKGDYKTFCTCLTDESLDAMITRCLHAVSILQARLKAGRDDSKVDRDNCLKALAIVARHGIKKDDLPAVYRELHPAAIRSRTDKTDALLKKIKDRPALVAEVMVVLLNTIKSEEKPQV